MPAPVPDLAKKWLVRLCPDPTVGSPSWTPVLGLQSYTPRIDTTKQDTTTYDSGLWKGAQYPTQLGWGGSGTVLRNRVAAIEDPGQKMLRLAAVPATSNALPVSLGVQIIDRFGGPDECTQGMATVTWEPQGGDATQLYTVNFTLDGDGFPAPIANPLAAALLPVVTAATPSGAAAGALVNIYGTGFTGTTGATGVKFAAVNATNYTVVSDGLIVATMPAGSAGSAPVTVTTPAGTSNAYPYTRA